MRVDDLIWYFEAQVLAAYRNEPDKYVIETDTFHGKIEVTDKHFRDLEAKDKTSDAISVRFGYRTLKDGTPAIAAFIPDLIDKSPTHIKKWTAFRLQAPEWIEQDARFEQWTQRYLMGSWEVENGPLSDLRKAVDTVNAITEEKVGLPLFAQGLAVTLPFPSAENSHKYEDAHSELYRYLIDGLEKRCIVALAACLQTPGKFDNDKTIAALKKTLPELADSGVFNTAFELVSEQRRKSDHKVRPDAVAFRAFQTFTEDLRTCVAAVRELILTLERKLGVEAENMTERHEAKKYLPVIEAEAEPHYSICQAEKLVGKTIERVEYGIRKIHPQLHQSEVLMIHFTDGSILGVDTGSNVMNLEVQAPGLNPNDFHVDFCLQWVPPK